MLRLRQRSRVAQKLGERACHQDEASFSIWRVAFWKACGHTGPPATSPSLGLLLVWVLFYISMTV